MTNTIQVHNATSLGTNGIPVRITSRRPTSIFPIGRNTRNRHNLISIKRQETSHRPVAPIRTLPNVMVLNARSIFNKVDELKAHIDNYKSDILFVCKTYRQINIRVRVYLQNLPTNQHSSPTLSSTYVVNIF